MKSTYAIIKDCRLFAGLSDAQKIELSEQFYVPVRFFRSGDIICMEGDTMNHLLLVVSGKVTGQKFYTNGDLRFLKLHESGEFINLETMGTDSHSAPLTYSAVSDVVEIAMIPMSAYFKCEHKQVLLGNMIRMLSDENIRNIYRIETLSRRGLRDRILAYLLIIKRKRGCNSFDIGMNQEQLAQFLCVNRSALSFELNKLKKEGVLDYKGRRYELLEEIDLMD